MSMQDTIIERMEILRLSNAESNKVTKECIQTALILLMKDKNFNDITVTEIVKKAGVSRTAYYRNYGNKEEILNNLLTEIADKVYKSMKKKNFAENDFEYWLAMFNDIQPYAETFKLLINAKFDESIQDSIFRLIQNDYTDMTIQEMYIEKFWSGAIYAVLKFWILNDMIETPKDMALLCCNVLNT